MFFPPKPNYQLINEGIKSIMKMIICAFALNTWQYFANISKGVCNVLYILQTETVHKYV